MAGKKIETEVAVSVTGEEKVEKLAKNIDKLEDTKVKVGVEADDRDVAKLIERVKQLSSQDAIVTLAIEAGAAQNELNDLLIDLREFRGTDAEAQVKIDRINETRDDIEKLSAEIKEIDGTTAEVRIDSSSAKQGIDDLGKSADSSKSVLANMVGNATQDLGALGGVAGSAGVAIGQMGEYMADARASGEGFASIIKNFAGVAGPIAAIGVGIQLFSSAMENLKAAEAFNDEVVDEFAESIRTGIDAAESLREKLVETGKLEFSVLKTGIIGVGQETRNITEDLARMNITFEQFIALAETGGRLDVGGLNIQDEDYDSVRRINDALGDFTRNEEAADAASKSLAKSLGFQSVAAMSAAEGWKEYSNQLENAPTDMPETFRQVEEAVARMERGLEPTAAQILAIENLTSRYGVTAVDVFELVGDTQEDAAERSREATEQTTEALDEWVETSIEAVKAAADLEIAMGELASEQDTRRLEAFTDAVGDLSSLDLAMPAINFNQLLQDEDQMKVIAEGWGTTLGSEASNAAIAAMASLSGTVNEQLISAFEQGGVQSMVDAASLMRVALFEQFGPEVGQQIIESMGLSDEQIVIAAKVAIDKSELDETLGLLALLDQDDVNTKNITIKYLAGGFEDNPQAFRDAVVGALEDEGATVPVTLKDVDTLQDELPELTAIDVPITADPADINAAADIIADDEKWQAELDLDPEQFDDALDAAVKTVEGSDPTAIMQLDTTQAMADARALVRVLQDILRFQGLVRAGGGVNFGSGAVAPEAFTLGAPEEGVELNALVGPEQQAVTTTTTTSGFGNPIAVAAGRPIVNNITNVTIPSADPSAMVRALQRWSRSNGALPISRGRG